MRTKIRLHARVSTLTLAAALAAGCSDKSPLSPENPAATAAATSTASETSNLIVPSGDRYVVVLRDEAAQAGRVEAASASVASAVSSLGGRVERVHKEIGVVAARGLSAGALASLRARPDVEGVAKDRSVRWVPRREQIKAVKRGGPRTESDQRGAFFFRDQWNLRVTRASNAWLVTPQGKGALVCVLDSGSDPTHQDLRGKIDRSKSTSFVVTEPELNDHLFHGTFVSAIITSNGLGVASVAPDARLCIVKVLDRTGSGFFEDVTAGIVFAGQVHATALNMSLGAYVDKTDPEIVLLNRATQRAINFARSQGTLAVAAAGNGDINLDTDPANLIAVPAELNNVISVGATGPVNQMNFDRRASYSNFGHTGVDLFAPGGDFAGTDQRDLIISACSSFSAAFPECVTGDFYLIGDGTSFATPHVAGEAAVIESNQPGNQNAARLEDCIRLGADRVSLNPGQRANVLFGATCQQVSF